MSNRLGGGSLLAQQVNNLFKKWVDAGKCENIKRTILQNVSRNMHQLPDIGSAQRVMSVLSSLGLRNDKTQYALIHQMLKLSKQLKSSDALVSRRFYLVQIAKLAAEAKIFNVAKPVSELLLQPCLIKNYTDGERDVLIKGLTTLKVKHRDLNNIIIQQLKIKQSPCANLLWAATETSVAKDSSLLGIYTDAISGKNPEKIIKSSDVVLVMWCLTKVGIKVSLSDLESQGIRAIKSGSLDSVDTTQLAWCMAKLQYSNNPLNSEIASFYNSFPGNHFSQSVHSQLIWSFSHTRWYNKDLFTKLVSNFTANIEKEKDVNNTSPVRTSGSLISAVNVLWSIQTCRHQYGTEAAVLFTYLHKNIHKLDIEEIASVLTSAGGKKADSSTMRTFGFVHRDLIVSLVNRIAEQPAILRHISTLRLLTLMCSTIIKLDVLSIGFMQSLKNFIEIKKNNGVNFFTSSPEAVASLLRCFAIKRQIISQQDRIELFNDMAPFVKIVSEKNISFSCAIMILWSYARVRLTRLLKSSDNDFILSSTVKMTSNLRRADTKELSQLIFIYADFNQSGIPISDSVEEVFSILKQKSKNITHQQLSSCVLSLEKLNCGSFADDIFNWIEKRTSLEASNYGIVALVNLIPAFVTLRSQQDSLTKLLHRCDVSSVQPETVVSILSSLQKFSYSNQPVLLNIFKQAAVHYNNSTLSQDQLAKLKKVLIEYNKLLGEP